MAGYDFRARPETADKLSFYLFDNLKMQDSGEGGNVYRFDTMAEAIIGFRMIQAEHPNWTIALGGSIGGDREIDFVHRRAGANVLVDDYRKIDFWSERPDVMRAVQEFEAGPGIEWQTNRDLLNTPIFIPYISESAPDDPILTDKALLPTNPENVLTSISEAFVEGEGWIGFDRLEEITKEYVRNPDDRPKVSALNVAYEVAEGNSIERGRTGYIDIKPNELYGMAERFYGLREIRGQEQESQLTGESGIDMPAADAKLPDYDVGRLFYDYDTSYGEVEKVTIEIYNYENDNLYVGMNYFDRDMGAMDFYGDLTVNIVQLPPFMAAIDTNNNNAEKIMGFLKENNFGELTGGILSSGYCTYPVFRFNEEKLAEANPGGFERYCKEVGINPKLQDVAKDSLDDLKKQARDRALEKNAERSEKTVSRTHDLEL